jgi:hypothetical protein
MPLFLVAVPPASTGLISIAIEAWLDLKEGSFNRNMPGMLVGLLSQSLDWFRKADSLSSTDMMIDTLQAWNSYFYVEKGIKFL